MTRWSKFQRVLGMALVILGLIGTTANAEHSWHRAGAGGAAASAAPGQTSEWVAAGPEYMPMFHQSSIYVLANSPAAVDMGQPDVLALHVRELIGAGCRSDSYVVPNELGLSRVTVAFPAGLRVTPVLPVITKAGGVASHPATLLRPAVVPPAGGGDVTLTGHGWITTEWLVAATRPGTYTITASGITELSAAAMARCGLKHNDATPLGGRVVFTVKPHPVPANTRYRVSYICGSVPSRGIAIASGATNFINSPTTFIPQGRHSPITPAKPCLVFWPKLNNSGWRVPYRVTITASGNVGTPLWLGTRPDTYLTAAQVTRDLGFPLGISSTAGYFPPWDAFQAVPLDARGAIAVGFPPGLARGTTGTKVSMPIVQEERLEFFGAAPGASVPGAGNGRAGVPTAPTPAPQPGFPWGAAAGTAGALALAAAVTLKARANAAVARSGTTAVHTASPGILAAAGAALGTAGRALAGAAGFVWNGLRGLWHGFVRWLRSPAPPGTPSPLDQPGVPTAPPEELADQGSDFATGASLTVDAAKMDPLGLADDVGSAAVGAVAEPMVKSELDGAGHLLEQVSGDLASAANGGSIADNTDGGTISVLGPNGQIETFSDNPGPQGGSAGSPFVKLFHALHSFSRFLRRPMP